MKRLIKSTFIILLALLFVIPSTAYASDEDTKIVPEWEDISLTDKEIEEIYALNPDNNTSQEKSSTLIYSYKIAISKDGTNLLLVAKTIGSTSVVKAGFTEIKIQRRANSSSSWTNYITYTDIYSNATFCSIAKTISVMSGYQYRATCIHYAKKNIFSTERINNTSNTITI